VRYKGGAASAVPLLLWRCIMYELAWLVYILSIIAGFIGQKIYMAEECE
jgi:hypothetical protein